MAVSTAVPVAPTPTGEREGEAMATGPTDVGVLAGGYAPVGDAMVVGDMLALVGVGAVVDE